MEPTARGSAGPNVKAHRMSIAASIRMAAEDDAASLLQIYRPSVEETAVSFENALPSERDFAGRIRDINARWVWLVAEVAGEVAGYAYASRHREREADRLSVEASGVFQRSCPLLGSPYLERRCGRAGNPMAPWPCVTSSC